MPVPAEVICTSPRFKTSRLPMESALLVSRQRQLRVGHALCLLLKLSRDDIREDLVFAVRMCTEAGLGLDTVLVQDSERTELRVFAVAVAVKYVSPTRKHHSSLIHLQCKREGVECLEPAVFGVAALFTGASNKADGHCS